MTAIRLILIACLGFLAGCQALTGRGVTPTVVPPASTATAEQISGLEQRIRDLEQQLEHERELAARAAGSVYGAGAANGHNPDGLPKSLTAAQITEAESALPTPTAEQKAVKDAQNAKALAGQLSEVLAEMKVAGDENKKLRDDLASARLREADALRQLADQKAAGERERAEASRKLQEHLDKMTARIKAAEDEARNKVMIGQVESLNEWGAWLTGAGVLMLGIAGVFGGIAALRTVGPIAVLSVLAGLACFGLAQIVSQSWFKWAVLGVVGVGFAVCGWWVWKKHQAGVLKERLAQKADALTGTLKEIVPVLDEAYDGAEAQVKDLLDRTIFQRLKDAMTDDQRALVKSIRKGQQPTP